MEEDFWFVDIHQPNLPVKSKELALSAARAHSSRVAHERFAKARGGLKSPRQSRSRSFRAVTLIPYRVLESTSAVAKAQSRPPSSSTHGDSEPHGNHVTNRIKSTRFMANQTFSSIFSSLIPQPNLDGDSVSTMFWQVSALSSTKICRAMRVRGAFTPEWLHLLMDEAFYHVGAALVKYEHNLLLNPDHQQVDVLVHKARAMNIIRQRIEASNGVLDNITLLAIMFLPFLENPSEIRPASLLHWEALSELLKARLRVSRIEDQWYGTYTVDTIYQWHTFCKEVHGFNILEDKTKRGDESRQNNLLKQTTLDTAEAHPHGFRQLARQGLIGLTSIAMVQNVLQLLDHKSTSSAADRLPDDLQQGELTTSFQESWNLHDFTASSTPDEPSIDQVLPVAVLLYTARVVAGPLRSVCNSVRCAQALLTRNLQNCVTIREPMEERALFWAWSVLVGSFKTRFDQLSHDGLVLLEAQKRRFPWCLQPHVAGGVVQQFFYDDELTGDCEQFLKT